MGSRDRFCFLPPNMNEHGTPVHNIEQSAQLLPNHIKDNNKRELLCTK